jgi:hypothetical protein
MQQAFDTTDAPTRRYDAKYRSADVLSELRKNDRSVAAACSANTRRQARCAATMIRVMASSRTKAMTQAIDNGMSALLYAPAGR